MRETAVRRIHRMPFGAEPVETGFQFRLWAPSAQRVDLLAGGTEADARAMERRGDGFFELEAADAGDGFLYRYRIDGGHAVPDPASRWQPDDAHGPSRAVDPRRFGWTDGAWRGRPWEETVLYELHVGTYTRDGSFDGVRRRLDHLVELGVTAVELMPLADFPGRRNWGYDGVLPFAPDSSYGAPDDLKRLVQAAHERGLSVFLDVVYNHFGPEGNWLGLYARSFFKSDARTDWGDAIDFDGPLSRWVRDFFVHNALYWLEEYHLDGLRLDAVHAIHDRRVPGFLDELARAVGEGPGRDRHVHLVLETVANEARRLARSRSERATRFVAQWNDDVHHALHCLLTGEAEGYYADFTEVPARHLARALAEGFAWQGERSPYHGAERGEPSAHLPPTAFVDFLQNHDQVGNRALGERLTTLVDDAPLAAAMAVVLLAPSIPMLFMGEEWGARTPFPFFCDFGPELAAAVREGRRREFARFPAFRDPERRERIPDPNAPATFEAAVLGSPPDDERSRRWLDRTRALLAVRRAEIVPLLGEIEGGAGRFRLLGERTIEVSWALSGGARLTLLANLDGTSRPVELPAGLGDLEARGSRDGRQKRVIFDSRAHDGADTKAPPLGPWQVVSILES